MLKIKSLLLACGAAAALALPAHASSDEAWEAFRQQIDEQCLALAAELMSEVELRIDPFGSERYGTALISGSEGGERVDRICVIDKQTGLAELGTPLPPLAEGVARVELEAASQEVATGGPPCEGACAATEEELADSDVESLRAVGAQVQATLAGLAAGSEAADDDTRRIAAIVSEGAPDLDFAAVAPGAYDCTVYWYGFLDQGAREVGAHQCRVVAAEDGALGVEKLSGEGLNAALRPWVDGLRAFIGRTYLDGHAASDYDAADPSNAENANFGNKVGVALADQGRLYLVSTQNRGMEPQDATFFEVIELVPAE